MSLISAIFGKSKDHLRDTLKQKYQPVLDKIREESGDLLGLTMDGKQLYIKALMPTEESRTRVWDEIKKVDPSYLDLRYDIKVKVAEPQPKEKLPPGQLHSLQGRKVSHPEFPPENQQQNKQEVKPQTQEPPQTYIVQPGDTLAKIAEKFYGDLTKYDEIAKANGVTGTNRIRIGQKIVIPPLSAK